MNTQTYKVSSLFTLSFFSSILPSLVLPFCSPSLSCCVPVIFDLSFYLSLFAGKVGDKRGEMGTGDGWMHCCINSGLLSGAVGDYQKWYNILLPSSLSFHVISLFILLSASVFHWPCSNLCSNFILYATPTCHLAWKKDIFLFLELLFLTLPLLMYLSFLCYSPLLSHSYYSQYQSPFVVHCFPIEFVCLIKRLTHW